MSSEDCIQCKKYFKTYDRTIDQMVQAARLTSFLLPKQIKALEKDFLKQGGLRERMSQARIEVRRKQQ